MDNSPRNSKYSSLSNPLIIHHAIRQDLTPEEDEQLTKRLASATISYEASIIFDEMRVAAIESLANIYYNPENPATYAAMVMEAKVRALVLTEILTQFKDKIR